MAIKINWKDLAKRIINWQEVQKVMLNGSQIWPNTIPPTPVVDYLCFTANTANSTIALNKQYNAKEVELEISYNKTTWIDYNWTNNSWDIITLNNIWDKIYFRNKSETVTDLSSPTYYWVRRYTFAMTWSISASGDINTLLCKYSTTTLPQPISWQYWGSNTFTSLFENCTSLTTAPSLPATTLNVWCYNSMFKWCTNLISAPNLPSLYVPDSWYRDMFRWCSSLISTPSIIATSCDDYSLTGMFYGCTSLTTANITLPSLLSWLYNFNSMFMWCTSLVTAPSLPATTLTDSCYGWMFYNCTNLITPPLLPATTLAPGCYSEMFYNCTHLTTAPSLPATTLAQQCYNSMFKFCYELTSLPSLPATTLAQWCYYDMFNSCSLIKLSDTQTWDYQTSYRIPITWTWTEATNSMKDMFKYTWWTFTGTPTINTTYYTSNTIIS